METADGLVGLLEGDADFKAAEAAIGYDGYVTAEMPALPVWLARKNCRSYENLFMQCCGREPRWITLYSHLPTWEDLSSLLPPHGGPADFANWPVGTTLMATVENISIVGALYVNCGQARLNIRASDELSMPDSMYWPTFFGVLRTESQYFANCIIRDHTPDRITLKESLNVVGPDRSGNRIGSNG